MWNNFHAPEDVEPALDESLKNLGTDYLDLYLIHWFATYLFFSFSFYLPYAGSLFRLIAFNKESGPNGENVYDAELSENPYPTWQKLEELVEKGKIRNIGISKKVFFTV